MPTQAQINQAYSLLKTALLVYTNAKSILLNTQHLYENQLAIAVSTGEIGNKNDNERLAGMIEKYPDIVVAYQKAKVDEQAAKFNLDFAKLEVEHLKTLIEVVKGAN